MGKKTEGGGSKLILLLIYLNCQVNCELLITIQVEC